MPTPDQLLAVIGVQSEVAKLGLDLGGILSLIVDRTLTLVGADGAAIELAEGDDMVYRAASGTAAGQIGLRIKAATSLSGLCVRTGDILRCDDSETDPRVDRAACRAVGLRSMIVMPLKHDTHTVGVLKAMSVQTAKFAEGDVKVLGLLSELVAAAIYHATKFDAEDLYRRATQDGLTGLANRSAFMERLRGVVAEREKRAAAVLMLDMDGLKQVNDNHGHRAGDAVIAEFGNRLRTAARLSDTVARLGGDEFAVILMPMDLPEALTHAIERLTAAIEPPFEFEGRQYQLRASVGAAHFPHEGHGIEELIELADQRMYSHKRERRQQQAG